MPWKGWDLIMRSTDEQFQEILRRSDRLRVRQSSRRVVAGWAIASVVCAAFLILAACFLPSLQTEQSKVVSMQYGSLLLGASYMGYVVIGVFAFLLGSCVTVLAIRIRKMREMERDNS